MAKTMLDYIKDEPELRERFVKYAFKENSNIKNFDEFQTALFTAFDSNVGKRASKFFNNDEVNELFESKEAKEKIKDNVSDEEFKKLYKDENIVIRDVPKGKEIKPSQIHTLNIQKPIKATGQRNYYRSQSQEWTKSQINFIKVRKNKKMTIKKIFHQYNRHFKENPRTQSSIKNKTYRI